MHNRLGRIIVHQVCHSNNKKTNELKIQTNSRGFGVLGFWGFGLDFGFWLLVLIFHFIPGFDF